MSTWNNKKIIFILTLAGHQNEITVTKPNLKFDSIRTRLMGCWRVNSIFFLKKKHSYLKLKFDKTMHETTLLDWSNGLILQETVSGGCCGF